MTLTRRQPTRALPFRSAVERLFEDWPVLTVDGGIGELTPPMDVRETDDAYVVEAELPGIDPANVEVMVEGRTLTIRGHFAEETEKEEANYLLRERRRGRFMRAVTLPGMVEVEKVSSRYEDGQLIITLPKSSQNRARRIEISASGSKRSHS